MFFTFFDSTFWGTVHFLEFCATFRVFIWIKSLYFGANFNFSKVLRHLFLTIWRISSLFFFFAPILEFSVPYFGAKFNFFKVLRQKLYSNLKHKKKKCERTSSYIVGLAKSQAFYFTLKLSLAAAVTETTLPPRIKPFIILKMWIDRVAMVSD